MSQFSVYAYTQTAVEHSRRTMLLLLSDCAVLFGSVILTGLIRQIPGADLSVSENIHLLLVLFLAPLLNYLGGLYGPTPPALPEELRELGISTSVAYICIAMVSFLERGSLAPSRFVFLVSWVLSLGLVPLVRVQVRKYFARKSWWRVPAILCGSGRVAAQLDLYLRAHPQAGLSPLALYEGEENGASETDTTLLRLESREDLHVFSRQHPDACALVVMEKDAPHARRQALVDQATLLFSSVILVPEEFANGEIPFWIRPLEIGSLLCLKIRQNLLDPRRLALKRCADFILAFLGSVVLLPVFAVIAVGIVIESPGPVFFRQRRIGRDGKTIRILKFRTMVRDAEAALQRYLDSDPALRAEWEADQKLRNDPRITRVGGFLRRTSLDELPQLWNVLWGEMSLVGPRPIVDDEIVRYGTAFDVYTRVRPGITGLWQVSGRNNLSYDQRVHCDRYYICNWSIWMDVLILARTVPVVLGRKGAY